MKATKTWEKAYRVYTNVWDGRKSNHHTPLRFFDTFKEAWQFADHWHKMAGYDKNEHMIITYAKENKELKMWSLDKLVEKYGHWE